MQARPSCRVNMRACNGGIRIRESRPKMSRVTGFANLILRMESVSRDRVAQMRSVPITTTFTELPAEVCLQPCRSPGDWRWRLWARSHLHQSPVSLQQMRLYVVPDRVHCIKAHADTVCPWSTKVTALFAQSILYVVVHTNSNRLQASM